MRQGAMVIVGVTGMALGMVATMFYSGQPRSVGAASNDRYQDYVMSTGAVTINPRIQTDGVWLLDYKSGKLLGTVIDKTQGKIVGFAEVDLATEFGVEPRQDVHFMMTTGYVTQGQSALYIAETTTGKFGVYTMGAGTNGNNIVIRRHDMTNFRQTGTTAPAADSAGALPRDPAGGLPAGVPVIAPQTLPPTPTIPAPAAPGSPIIK
ncbi:hypothetical protein [Limnoglobus roseus]|uniref:Uncharacterized protein n=1 Tax=Limnoglobus roseus TaxID=2598579 RepID=A0A5C1AL50_9BACT|nr:hypothetical protein [Limnoglobus roseus]QEL18452.1 hypothetical protein PX52LOC_05477 [Limnoglobus roseus]